jgi:hypothetical protein
LSKLGMCVIIANTMEQCSLFLPLLRGAGPMALIYGLMGNMMMMITVGQASLACVRSLA